jgi:hypothetical protein
MAGYGRGLATKATARASVTGGPPSQYGWTYAYDAYDADGHLADQLAAGAQSQALLAACARLRRRLTLAGGHARIWARLDGDSHS